MPFEIDISDSPLLSKLYEEGVAAGRLKAMRWHLELIQRHGRITIENEVVEAFLTLDDDGFYKLLEVITKTRAQDEVLAFLREEVRKLGGDETKVRPATPDEAAALEEAVQARRSARRVPRAFPVPE